MEYKSYFIFLATLLLFRRAVAPPVAESISNTQLQNFVEPESYNLSINVTRKGTNPSIYGHVSIKVRCVEESYTMILNAKNMIIPSNEVSVILVTEPDQSSRPRIKNADFYENKPESGLFVIDMEKALEKYKDYSINIPFTSDTESVDFQEQFLYDFERNWIRQSILQITSRFTQGGASLLFPCFEETNVKAKFKIMIAHDKDMTALSNWPVQPEEENSQIVYTTLLSDEVRDKFKETAPILPSGVAFAVIDLKSTELYNSQSKVLIRIWADERSFDRLEVAKGVALNAMLFYLGYFKVSLDSTKLDIVAIPKIDKGDIDKLGLISFEESSLLCTDGDYQKYFDITRIMCSAINHQWIGASVTLSDSNDYFHHALSYFLEEMCINKMKPDSDFNFINLRNVITFNNVLMPTWEKPAYSEFESVFNHKLPDLDTQKAYHLIRMLFSVLKETAFQDSLVAYVEKFKYSFSSLKALWEAFTTEAKKAEILDESTSVAKIMNFWNDRQGFPLIRMKVNSSTKMVTLSQEAFVFLGKKRSGAKHPCWPIPLTFISKTGRKFEDSNIPKWLPCDKTQSFTVDLDLDEWIIVNSRLDVPSRTHLDDENWLSIQKTLLYDKKFSNLDELTRANLLSDMFALAETGEVPYIRVFQTMKYLSQEPSASCWTIALTEFDKINSYLLGEKEVLELFQTYVAQILEPHFGGHSTVRVHQDSNKETDELWTDAEAVILDHDVSKKIFDQSVNARGETTDEEPTKPFGSLVNIEDLPESDRLKKELKKLIVKTACKFGVDDCKDQSVALYEKWRKSVENKEHPIKEIPIEIRDIVLCSAIKWSRPSKDVWNNIREMYDNTKTSTENDIILTALGCSSDENTLKEYLKTTLDETFPGDHLKVFVSLSSNAIGYPLMKTFLMENFHNLHNHIKGPWRDQSIKLETYFIELFSITTNRKEMTELVNFTKRSDVTKVLDLNNPTKRLRKLKESVERTYKNINWVEKNRSIFLEDLNSSLSLYYEV